MKEKDTRNSEFERNVWESTKDLLSYSTWLPEVVGTSNELIHIGSVSMPTSIVPVCPTNEVIKPVAPDIRFKDSDVSKYRNLLSIFRRRHLNSAKDNR